MPLFISNECPCQSSDCKTDLNNTFKELLRNQSQNNIRDFTSMLKGTKKSEQHASIFCRLLTHLAFCEEFDKEMLEAYLELFTVLFLKSNNVFKEALLCDLYGLIVTLQQAEIKIFVEKQFYMKIVLFKIYQLKHCISK